MFTGWQKDVASIYADIDLNVLVSKNEGTPVTLIEGLACGVPVLCTDVGGIRDFANHKCGTIVDAHISPEGLADHLERLLNDPEALKPLNPGVSGRILEQFDVSRLVEDMQQLYDELLHSDFSNK